MCSIKKNEKWLLIEKNNGNREVVNVRSLLNSAETQLAIGSVVTLAVCEEEDKSAKIIAAAREAHKLEQLLIPTQVEDDKKPSDSDSPAHEPQEDGDFSGSESSWAPSGSSSSSEASNTEEKTPIIRQYLNKSGRVLTPCTRVNAIIPNVIPPKQKQYSNSASKNKSQTHGNKKAKVKNELNFSATEPITSNTQQQQQQGGETVDELAIINNLFLKIFKLISDVKTQNVASHNVAQNEVSPNEIHNVASQNGIQYVASHNGIQNEAAHNGIQNVVSKSPYDYQDVNHSPITDLNGNHNANRFVLPYSINQDQSRNQSNIKAEESTISNIEHNMSEDEYARSEDSNRSDDNVLISNKYAIVGSPKTNENNQVNHSINSNCNQTSQSKSPEDEWIPIGSGQTLVHKDQFKKVNWRSYTMATRTLLLAVFPRHILATHSLTGKKSPAFQNKPAKMCLDQRAIQDVIIEITDRFNVKENLVRTIITTKCADECKMMKIKKEKMKSEMKHKNKRIKTETVIGRDLNHTS